MYFLCLSHGHLHVLNVYYQHSRGTRAPFSNIDERGEVACALIYERLTDREKEIETETDREGRRRG